MEPVLRRIILQYKETQLIQQNSGPYKSRTVSCIPPPSKKETSLGQAATKNLEIKC